MADGQALKTKISSACKLPRSNDAQIEELRNPFEFPSEKTQREEYMRRKTADLNYLSRGISQGKQLLDKYVKEAIERIDRRAGQKEQEKFMMDLKRHLEDDANSLDILTVQWLNKIEFRLEELAHQATLTADAASSISQQATRSDNSGADNQTGHLLTPGDRSERIRRPLLEVPIFSGDFREFTTFWSAFQSLIHDDVDL
ncbi:unnamed protein product [Heligmosomoides polygyrus]|uniref:Uncharacterized protein n=1 Tax=Heligmosomoides polygyrus TaxID=6339 RepID=A0A183GNM6_HELPZ|nr:unnamed protein product [Heligmosomoides polygyrus]